MNRTDGRSSAHPCAPSRALHLLRGGPPSPAPLRNRDLEVEARVLAHLRAAGGDPDPRVGDRVCSSAYAAAMPFA
jgi:hypothetical protein